jgi:predicted transglutaminase-like cysteine proteinase
MLKRAIFALALSFLAAQPARADWSSLFGSQAEPPAFGMRETYSRDIGVFYKWTEVLARMDMGGAVPQPWLDNDLSGLSLRQQAATVNRIVNGYRDVPDDENWGQEDYWETPAEFFTRGGDCEDFAIAKYAWLRWLGVPEDRLRLAMVYDRVKQSLHMLLVVYTEGGTLFLDNQRRDIREHNNFRRYWPIYSINRDGRWIVDQRGKGRQIVQSVLATAVSGGR